MNQHPVITADFPENMSGGIMICGYNFGFSSRDQKNEDCGVEATEPERSFFSDSHVNNTLFRNRLLKWNLVTHRIQKATPDPVYRQPTNRSSERYTDT